MIKLPKRLEAIANIVPLNSNIIDIGCDHGLLDIYLCQKGISQKIIASDINKSALSNAIANIKKEKLERSIETRLGDGLNTIKESDQIDTAIISGMGAHTIVGILKNNLNTLKKINTIIIQSNTKNYFLRKEITKLNYLIADEKIVKDKDKIYIIIKFIKGKRKYSRKELYFGPILLKENSKLFQEYQHKELEKLLLLQKIIPKNKIIDRYKILKEIKLYN
ncbi:MAG: class I SAM-dependent methyltransferase [Bacilli bacterium]